jgi:hypothetical protein
VSGQGERGQVLALFAILLPMFLGLGGLVVAGGTWFTKAKHLQTKADAGAHAGGNTWAFPCGPGVNARIAAEARRYAGQLNPQVGNVSDAGIRIVLNGGQDGDGSGAPAAICETMRLDVEVTETESFPLFSLLPFSPDIKRKAVVEIQEGHSFGGAGLLPIAVPLRLPAAVFYDEANGQILPDGVKYFVESTSNGLGWSTGNPESPEPWARFRPAATTGVLIAISFRGACRTNLPSPNTLIPTSPAPCFEDEGFDTVDELCNQGSIPIVRCYFAPGDHPNQQARAGLHFIRGYEDANPGTGPPAIEGAWLENATCPPNSNGYYNWQRTATGGADCEARLNLRVDVGTLEGEYPGGVGVVRGPLRAEDVRVRFRLVRGRGPAQCDYGSQCNLMSVGSRSGPNLDFSTQGTNSSPHLRLTPDSRENAVAIRVRLRNAVNSSDPACQTRRWCSYFYTGTGLWTGRGRPSRLAILAAPVQRSFQGTTRTANSVQSLRLTADANCAGTPESMSIDGEAASQQLGDHCFVVDMRLEDDLRVAQDVDDPPTVFTDGTDPSRTRALDCDNPSVPLSESVEKGCGPWYARHSFDFRPLCAEPNPGPPFECVRAHTETEETGNQLREGFLRRLFDNPSPRECPVDAPGFVKGRNYWNPATNLANGGVYGYRSGDRDTYFHPADPRVVTIFLVPPWTFTQAGQETYPIAGFVQVYVTGFGRLGEPTSDDPCSPIPPPQVSEYECQGEDCGYVVWGHFLNYVVPGSGARPAPDGRRCNPDASVQPCVAVLVE